VKREPRELITIYWSLSESLLFSTTELGALDSRTAIISEIILKKFCSGVAPAPHKDVRYSNILTAQDRCKTCRLIITHCLRYEQDSRLTTFNYVLQDYIFHLSFSCNLLGSRGSPFQFRFESCCLTPHFHMFMETLPRRRIGLE
jgi:hypothetical protein